MDNQYQLFENFNQLNWYLKWKDNIIQSLKNNTNNFLNYSNEQIKKNNLFLEQNREKILNFRKFPVTSNLSIKSAPNYQEAIRRINRPISNSLSGINLNKIEIQDNEVNTSISINNSVEGNVWIRKMIIPIYDGKTSFSETSKAYFYGSEKRHNFTIQEIQRILPEAYKFCYNYNRTSRSVNTDLMNLISFINRNPVTGLQQNQNIISDLQAIKNNQYNNQQKASNNPNNNVINADVDYNSFINTYFSDILNEDQIQDSTNKKNKITDIPKVNNNVKIQSNDVNQISAKRKQIACNILQDTYNAKLTAMGLLYRDFMNIMENQVSSYKNK